MCSFFWLFSLIFCVVSSVGLLCVCKLFSLLIKFLFIKYIYIYIYIYRERYYHHNIVNISFKYIFIHSIMLETTNFTSHWGGKLWLKQYHFQIKLPINATLLSLGPQTSFLLYTNYSLSPQPLWKMLWHLIYCIFFCICRSTFFALEQYSKY